MRLPATFLLLLLLLITLSRLGGDPHSELSLELESLLGLPCGGLGKLLLPMGYMALGDVFRLELDTEMNPCGSVLLAQILECIRESCDGQIVNTGFDVVAMGRRACRILRVEVNLLIGCFQEAR